MPGKYPILSSGEFIRDREDDFLFGAHFFHPAVGAGYVGEDGTTTTYIPTHPGIPGNCVRNVVVSFDDQEGIGPIRVSRYDEAFPRSMVEAVNRAIQQVGCSIPEPEVI